MSESGVAPAVSRVGRRELQAGALNPSRFTSNRWQQRRRAAGGGYKRAETHPEYTFSEPAVEGL